MSDRQVAAILPHLVVTQDPRLNQYLAAIYSRGVSLRQIGSTAGISYETVRTRIRLAEEEQRKGVILDLSDLPAVTVLPKVKKAKTPYFMSEEVKQMLRVANADAQKYRHHGDPALVHAFHQLVLGLVAQGVPMSKIAEACGQDRRHMMRRMRRWGIRPSRRARRVRIVQMDIDPPRQAQPDRVIKAIQPVQIEPDIPCRWPDCPSHSGGVCIHG